MLNEMQIQIPQGLPPGHIQQGPNGPMYYTGPNMNPMPMYPTMVYNQQGMLVPVMSVMPPSMPPHVTPVVGSVMSPGMSSSQITESRKGEGSSLNGNNNGNRPQPQQEQAQQQQTDLDHSRAQQREFSQNHGQAQFDRKLEGMTLPPEGLDAGGLSFGSYGSMMLSESEMKNLQGGGTSLGNNPQANQPLNSNNSSANSNDHAQIQQQQYAHKLHMQQQYLQQQQQFLQQQQQLIQHYQQQQQQNQAQQQQSQHQFHGNQHNTKSSDDVGKSALPPDGGLEPQGLSFGSVSFMSIGDAKLENTGISFGSAMSFKMTPDVVGGGLEGIGTSFGSMTLDTNRGDDPFDPQNNPHSIVPPPPTEAVERQTSAPLPPLFQQNRSSVNLLDCSDTDSETEEQSAQRSHHKSIEWEKMKAVVDAGSGENANTGPVPIAQPKFPSSFSIPSTTFQRDFSQMSALSVGDAGDADDPNLVAAAAVSPPPPKKQNEGGEWQNADLVLLKSQQSGRNSNHAEVR